MIRFILFSFISFSFWACAQTVDLELNFPSADTFVRSETARVFVANIEKGEEGSCPDLLARAELGVLDEIAVMDSGQKNVCEFQTKELEFSDVPHGKKAYVAVTQSESGEVWLSGCTVFDVSIDPSPLRIVLSPTENYRNEFPPGGPGPMCTVDSKCQRGCRE